MSRNSTQRLLYQLVQSSLKLHKSFSQAEGLKSQCQKLNILTILRTIDFKQLHLQSKEKEILQGVGICNIYEQHPLRISLYYLPPGQTMKLHNHPQMEVISYMCKGKMEARLFTHIKDDLYRKKIILLQKGSASFIDGNKNKQENLHEFYALEPSYFLDIIFPDYDENRQCKFYEEVGVVDATTIRLKELLNYDVVFTGLN